MSRSGYSDDCENVALWRRAVENAINGKRGQAFLREMAAALDAMPEKRLVRSALVCPEGVCAMGAVAVARGIDTAGVDAEEPFEVSHLFDIARVLAAEIAFENDDDFHMHRDETPEARWRRMRAWVAEQLGEVWPATDFIPEWGDVPRGQS